MHIMHTDPVLGLYSAALGPFLFALFGTSKHLSIGPISLASIYIPIALKALGFNVHDASEAAKAARGEAAMVLTFYVFIIFLVMSILRLGLIIRFISHNVLAGFVTATGIYVMINELRYVRAVPGGGVLQCGHDCLSFYTHTATTPPLPTRTNTTGTSSTSRACPSSSTTPKRSAGS